MKRFLLVAGAPLLVALAGCGPSERQDPAAALAAGKLAEAEIAVRAALQDAPADPALLLLGGKIAFENSNFEMAKTRLSRLLAMQPENQEARILLARSQLSTNGGQDALETLGDGKPASGEAYAVAVAARINLGETPQALALIEEGTKAFPKSPDLLAISGEVSLALGDVEAAARSARQALEAAPSHIDAQVLSAHVAIAQRELAKASAILDKVLTLRPENVSALIAQATVLHDLGRKEEAEQLFTKAANKFDGRSSTARYFLAQMAFDAGNVNQAEKILLNVDRNSIPEAAMLSGLIAAKRNQPEQAAASLRTYLATGRQDIRAQIALAAALAETGDHAEALATIAPVADAANAAPAVLALAADLATKVNAPSAASYRARVAAAATADPHAAKMTEADKLVAKGDWAKADAIYSSILASQPDSKNIVLLNNAAMAKLETGKMDEALVLARKARALAPKDPIVADTLGWIIFKSGGSQQEALELIRSAMIAQPRNTEIRQHAAALARAMEQ